MTTNDKLYSKKLETIQTEIEKVSQPGELFKEFLINGKHTYCFFSNYGNIIRMIGNQAYSKDQVKISYTEKGYQKIYICGSWYRVNRCVATLFCDNKTGRPLKELHCHHRNRQITDNRSINLRWMTVERHSKWHSIYNRLFRKGGKV